jgi:hypothetical protein
VESGGAEESLVLDHEQEQEQELIELPEWHNKPKIGNVHDFEIPGMESSDDDENEKTNITKSRKKKRSETCHENSKFVFSDNELPDKKVKP